MWQPELVGSVGVFQDWALCLAHFPVQAQRVSFQHWTACKVSQARAGAQGPGCLFLLDGACNSIPRCQILEMSGGISTGASPSSPERELLSPHREGQREAGEAGRQAGSRLV